MRTAVTMLAWALALLVLSHAQAAPLTLRPGKLLSVAGAWDDK